VHWATTIFSGRHPGFAITLKTLAWLNQMITDMQEDVAMHAAFFRGLVEDKGLSSE